MQGRDLCFSDGSGRRIDFILAWNEKTLKGNERQCKMSFEKNLETCAREVEGQELGLVLEYTEVGLNSSLLLTGRTEFYYRYLILN